MAQPLYDFDGTFFRGMKSDSDPAQVPLGYYWTAMNMINVGGILSCRPGYRCAVTLPEGKLQGGALFRPRFGVEQIVVCIDGAVYVSPWPFVTFKQLPNVLMSPSAKQVFWCQTVQSARRKTTDQASSIEVIDPRNVLFIQDGGETAPAFYDGSESGHVRDNAFETPIGGPMVWVGDRLWVAHRNFVKASDISNPFSFREEIYLGGVSAFSFESDVTAMVRTPGLTNQNLLVFTNDNAELIKAYIRDRNSWPTTDDMQAEVFKVGCTSQRSVVSHFGRLSWFSASGIVMFDNARASQISSRLPVRDNEMSVSKTRLAEDLSLVAGAAFGSYLLMSVPSEDRFNKHTWVLNDASIETVSEDSGASWASYWTGTRPVEWIYGSIAGQKRIFHVSTDDDGQNRLWEAFRPERLDNDCPITWAMESRGYFGQSSEKKPPGELCKFGWAEVALVGIEEDLDLGIFYAGGLRGAYKNILAKQISVERGSLMPESEITATTQLFEFKPQSRVERTEEAAQKTDETGSCPVESDNNEDLDDSFQLLIVGHGPAAIRSIRAYSTYEQVAANGSNEACKDEEKFNAVRFDGMGVHAEDRVEMVEQLAAKEVRVYTGNKTVSITQDDVTAVGVGEAESVVSQMAADRVAERIATKRAELEVVASLPKILGLGSGL
jgi:hypothetical protein